ncbi:hypothetical protein AB0K21_40340 [Streptosporangium sp. NPDC049248]|uniref:hypothetical protein n=1 Tax=Streptosporangium sp. NPDC049248 TaxID=3155651 RepID=UPI00342A4A85
MHGDDHLEFPALQPVGVVDDDLIGAGDVGTGQQPLDLLGLVAVIDLLSRRWTL